jgi:uncharacterized membrane protein YbhN (UPF0104 family)
VATVVVDRILGLYGLFVIATICVLTTGLYRSPVPQVQAISQMTLICTGVGLVGLVMLIFPGFTTGAVSEFLRGLPKVGEVMGKLIDAVRIYRRKPAVLGTAMLMSMAVHSCATLGMYMLARGLFGDDIPSLGTHFVVVPLSMLAAAMPLPLMGLGAMEYALQFLYQTLARDAGEVVLAGIQVLKIAFSYRIVTIINAAIGGLVYALSRREMDEVLHDVEEKTEHAEDHPAAATSAAGPSSSQASTGG